MCALPTFPISFIKVLHDLAFVVSFMSLLHYMPINRLFLIHAFAQMYPFPEDSVFFSFFLLSISLKYLGPLKASILIYLFVEGRENGSILDQVCTFY